MYGRSPTKLLNIYGQLHYNLASYELLGCRDVVGSTELSFMLDNTALVHQIWDLACFIVGRTLFDIASTPAVALLRTAIALKLHTWQPHASFTAYCSKPHSKSLVVRRSGAANNKRTCVSQRQEETGSAEEASRLSPC